MIGVRLEYTAGPSRWLTLYRYLFLSWEQLSEHDRVTAWPLDQQARSVPDNLRFALSQHLLLFHLSLDLLLDVSPRSIRGVERPRLLIIASSPSGHRQRSRLLTLRGRTQDLRLWTQLADSLHGLHDAGARGPVLTLGLRLDPHCRVFTMGQVVRLRCVLVEIAALALTVDGALGRLPDALQPAPGHDVVSSLSQGVLRRPRLRNHKVLDVLALAEVGARI